MDFGYTPATDPSNGRGPKLSTFIILVIVALLLLGGAWLIVHRVG